MNTSPLYKQGETVILVSRKYPHLNGEYTIRAIHHDGDKYLDRVSKAPTNIKLTHVPFCYRFNEILRNDNNQELIVTEVQLRKKHTPGTVSFQRLMELV